jgi:hypothetical protein
MIVELLIFLIFLFWLLIPYTKWQMYQSRPSAQRWIAYLAIIHLVYFIANLLCTYFSFFTIISSSSWSF